MRPIQILKMLSSPIRAYVFLTVLYFGLVLLLPANKMVMAIYNLDAAQYHILLFAILAPYVLIWFAAFYGYAKLRDYAALIRDTNEGEEFSSLSTGLKWLAYGMPIISIISIILNTISNDHSGFHSTAIIINNYLGLLVPLIGFTIVSIGSRGLTAISNIKVSLSQSKVIIMVFVLLGVLYCFLTFRHFDLQTIDSTKNPYFLPLWLMLLTITIPFLYSWFIGLLAGYELILYSKHVDGHIYKQALKLIGYGIVVVIVSFIALQYVSAILPRRGYLSLNASLVISYMVRAVMVGGFISIAFGAKKLKRIEEV
jgi:hypothetical protein